MVAQASTGEIFRVHLNFPKVHHAVVEVHHNHPHLPPTVPQHLFRVGVAPPRNFLHWVPSRIFLPSLPLDAPLWVWTLRGQAWTGVDRARVGALAPLSFNPRPLRRGQTHQQPRME